MAQGSGEGVGHVRRFRQIGPGPTRAEWSAASAPSMPRTSGISNRPAAVCPSLSVFGRGSKGHTNISPLQPSLTVPCHNRSMD